MTSDIVVKICLMAISIISALVSAYIVPFIKSSKNVKEFTMFNDFVVNVVNAANQIFTPEQWKAKKQYALNLVKNYLNNNTGLTFTDEQLDAIIEGVVKEVKRYDKNNLIEN